VFWRVIKSYVPRIAKLFPKLQEELQIARMRKTAQQYIYESIVNAFMFSAAVLFLLLMLFTKIDISLLWLFPLIPGTFAFMIFFFLNIPYVYINQRSKEIDKTVLFAGRYLVVKIQSGEPLFNSLIGVSKSYGATSEVFNEIVQDIHFGAKIEDAIDKAIKNNPNDNLKKILWDISNSIKTGSDMTKTLKSMLESINEQYYTEIESYGRKINSLTLFYMVLAIIVPSLGMTMLAIISSFVGIVIPMNILYVIIFGVAVLQFMFLSMYKSIRPAVLV
jgi:flagellar protein FlaJ